jgi:hypothetical protein
VPSESSAPPCWVCTRDGDTITVQGSRRDLPGHDVIKISSFTSHWLKIHDP